MKSRALCLLLAMLMVIQVLFVSHSGLGDGGSGAQALGSRATPLEEGALFSDLEGQNEPVTFENVSHQTGLDAFTGNYFAWGDYNNDGYQDLLVNGRRLLRNDGPPTFSFTDLTTTVGLSGKTGVSVGIWGDYDNDGDLDVYLAGGGWTTSNPTRSDYLLQNEGAPDWTFTDVTQAAGGVVDDYPSVSAAWGDLDGDGWLDLYVANYETGDYEGYPDTLWHNDGDGTFTDVSVSWGIRSINAKPGRGVAFCDYDNDGDVDIHVSNYRIEPNILWSNDGTGRLTNVAATAGVTGDPLYYQSSGPYYGHTIGSSWADWNNDGYMDIWEANLVHKYVGGDDIRGYICDDSKFYQNDGPPSWSFTDVRASTGIVTKPIGGAGVYRGDELYDGIAWADFDHDGDLDVFMPQVYDLDYAYSYLYLNNGDGSFSDVGADYGARVWNTYGAAWADYDADGDLDLVTGGMSPRGTASRIHLFANSGNANNWLRVEVEGTASNAMGLGTRVTVTVGNTTMTRDVEGGTGSHAQMNDLAVEFGLGRATVADTVVVKFPSGHEMAYVDVAANTTLSVREVGTGEAPAVTANETMPFEDEVVELRTLAPAATSGTYTGFYWDVDGDSVFEVRTATPTLEVVWTERGLKGPRVAVAAPTGGGFLTISNPVIVDVRNALPVAVAGENVTLAEDEVLTLDGAASTDTTSDATNLEFRWTVDGDDRGWSTDPKTEVMWTTSGAHFAELFVRDDDGAVDSDRVNMNVINLPPVVADPGDIEAVEDELVLIHTTATDTASDQADLRYRIHFGDGNETGWMAEARREYVYRKGGIIQVRVDVKDNDGAIGSAYFNVTVRNVEPTCSISLQVNELDEGDEFNAYGSVADSFSDSESLRWWFDFGDGVETEKRRKPVTKVAHTYDASGTYTVTLYVQDNDGAINASSLEVVVLNVAPSAFLTGPARPVGEDAVVELVAEATDTTNDLPGIEYLWDMGDGTVIDWSTASEMTHSYGQAGKYWVEVAMRDSDGAQGTAQVLVTVENVSPEARASQSRTKALEDDVVSFNASASVDTPGDLATLNFTWVSEGRTQFGPQATFAWIEPGRHMVVLTVTDDDGDVDELYLPVDVENQVPTGQAVADMTEAKVDETLSFSVVDLSDTPSDLPKLKVTWEFGDGALALGESVTHAFEEEGNYIVKMTVKDDNGDQVDHFIPVTIEAEGGALASGSTTVIVAIAVVAVLAVIGALLFQRARGRDADTEDLVPDHEGEGDVIAENGEGTQNPGEDADDAEPGPEERDPPPEAGFDVSESAKYEENA